MNYLTGLANPALLFNKKKYGRYSNIRAREPNFKRCFASSFKEKRGHGPGKDKVGRGFSSLGTFKLKKISTVVHAPWCLGDLRHYTNHKQTFFEMEMNPHVYNLNRIRWDFFGTLTFAKVPPLYVRKACICEYLRRVAKAFRLKDWKWGLFYAVRHEYGEMTNRAHFHFLLTIPHLSPNIHSARHR